MDFPHELFLPQKVIFQRGGLIRLAQECLPFGKNGLLICGNSFVQSGKAEELSKSLKAEIFVKKSGEPTLADVSQVISKAKAIKAQWLVGVGGGSVLDLAKAASGLYNAKDTPAAYQQGKPLESCGIPFIAVPTTAGSGAEATINAVIINSQTREKLSIREPSFMAKTVILDAQLLVGLSKTTISYSGMDALTQAYESFVSRQASWFSQAYSLKALSLINENIVKAFEANDVSCLEKLLLGSFFAGIALQSARLGVIHGIAHPLGAFYNQPHGLICAICLPIAFKLNQPLTTRECMVLDGIVGGDFYKRVTKLLGCLGIVSPFKGQVLIEKEKIIARTLVSGSTKANPKEIVGSDVELILKEIF